MYVIAKFHLSVPSYSFFQKTHCMKKGKDKRCSSRRDKPRKVVNFAIMFFPHYFLHKKSIRSMMTMSI
jgi:hypothetical protein